MQINNHTTTYSLVDGGGLRTFFCDPMHRLRSSGYTLSGIYSIPHTKPWVSAAVHTLAKKKVVLAGFLVVIHKTITTLQKIQEIP